MNCNTFFPAHTITVKLNTKILAFLLLIFSFSLTLKSEAQTWALELSGSVLKDGRKLDGAIVTLFKEDAKIQEVTTPISGKFLFNLEPENDYIITCTKPGYITKRISCSTKNVSVERGKFGFAPFRFDITIFEIIEGVDINTLLNQPIAKINFDAKDDDFQYDKGYTNSIKEQLTKIREAEQAGQKYTAAIAKADALFTNTDYINAKENYSIALKIKPMEQYPKEQLKAIVKLLAEQEQKNAIEKEVTKKYIVAMNKGDKSILAKDYTAAKLAFNEASGIKPNEQAPKDKLKEIERILAENLAAEKALADKLAKEKAQAEKDALAKALAEKERIASEKALADKYTTTITKADKSFELNDYVNAKLLYNQAILIKPAEKYPKEKIAKIDLLLSKKTDTKPIKNEAVQPVTTAPVSTAMTEQERKKQYKNELVSKYAQGITEETIQETNYKIIKRIVVSGDEANVYIKKIWNWGGIFYFKDEIPISESSFENETKK